MLSTLTKTESEAASYEFTTLTCIPGVIDYNGANIQLLDLPGIIEGAAQGKGRGKFISRNFYAYINYMFLRAASYCCSSYCRFSANDVRCHKEGCAQGIVRKRTGECRY